jgi:hypothetical protein
MTEPVPTGGRVVIGPGGAREWKRFYDAPLTKEEQAATAWFNDLSPNEQYREVRRLRWNLDVARNDREALKRTVAEQASELDALRRKLATFTPEGFTLPAAAGDLLTLAGEHGWRSGRAWTVDDDGQSARLKVALTDGRTAFQLTWSCDLAGGGRMVRSGLAREQGRGWHDAPSLKKIREMIASAPEEPGL